MQGDPPLLAGHPFELAQPGSALIGRMHGNKRCRGTVSYAKFIRVGGEVP